MRYDFKNCVMKYDFHDGIMLGALITGIITLIVSFFIIEVPNYEKWTQIYVTVDNRMVVLEDSQFNSKIDCIDDAVERITPDIKILCREGKWLNSEFGKIKSKETSNLFRDQFVIVSDESNEIKVFKYESPYEMRKWGKYD